jgi:hypothetical protein
VEVFCVFFGLAFEASVGCISKSAGNCGKVNKGVKSVESQGYLNNDR